MEGDIDDPVAQYLKVATVLDCVPGHAEVPKVGKKIAILTLEHDGEIEQPLMLQMKDVKRLAIDFMGILAHHGSETAREIVERYFDGDGPDGLLPPPQDAPVDEEPESPSPEAKVGKPPRRRGRRKNPAEGLKSYGTIRLRYSPRREPKTYQTFGAYTDGHVVMVLYEFYDDNPNFPRHPNYSLVRLMSDTTAFVGCLDLTECLPTSEWSKFGKLRDGGRFKVRGKTWTKLTVAQFRARVDGRVIVANP